VLTQLLLFAVGIVVLLAGAWALVRGGSRLATLLGVPPVVIGLTIVAWGTSAPELVVSLAAALRGNGQIMLGNVIGSNQANIGLILGAAALLMRPGIDRRLLRFDLPFLLASTLVFSLMLLDGALGRWEGLVLLAGFAAITVHTLGAARRGEIEVPADEVPSAGMGVPLSGLMVLAGGGLLGLGGHLIVANAEQIARGLGVSEMVIGLTLVAIGTSLPEMAATLVAVWHGESGIAMGNVVGSNLFNLLAVGGLVPVVQPILTPGTVVHREVPAMLAMTLVMALLMNRRRTFPRAGGVLLLLLYAILMTWQARLWP